MLYRIGPVRQIHPVKMILEDYPSLTREHIRVALVFASELSLFEDVPYQVNQT